MNLYVFLLCVVTFMLLAIFLFLTRRDHRKDITQLLNRLMARDYKEYQYYERKFDKDIKEEESIRDEARKERAGVRKRGLGALEKELENVKTEESDLPGFEEDEELPEEL